MKLTVDGVMFYLGRLRKDGRRNVERVRMDQRKLLPTLRKAKVGAKMDGSRLF